MIALDLGSNSLRLLVFDCKSKEKILGYEKVVKTADGLAKNAKISSQALERIISTLKGFQNKIDFSSYSIRAVTTQALRQASNSQEILEAIYKATNIKFEIISGQEEAKLTLKAVQNRLNILGYPSKDFVLIDIGGASTELIFVYEDEIISQSFALGIVTIAQSYANLEEIEKALPQEMSAMSEFCQKVYEKKGRVKSFVATAGTPTTIASMKQGLDYAQYDADKINGTSLSSKELSFYLNKLLAMPFEEREKTVGTGRTDLILAGILIYQALYTLLGFESCVIIDDGLREGVALEGCILNAKILKKEEI